MCVCMKCTYLGVDLRDDPFEALAAVASVRADRVGEQILHVVAEWDAVNVDGGLLFEQRFTRFSWMRCVVEHFVDGDVPAEGQVYRFERHHFVVRIDHRPFAGVADFCAADDLKLEPNGMR